MARPAGPPPAARIAPQQRPQFSAPRMAPPQQRREAPAARIAPPAQNPVARIQQRQERQERNAERRRGPDATPRNVERAQRQQRPNAAPPVAPQQARQQLRQERLLQRREDRALRNVPPAQRAARREQIQQQRQERAAQRQGIQQNAVAPAARGVANAERAARRNGQARVTPQAARQGRFAARFANAQGQNNARNGNRQNARPAFSQARIARYAPRRAWQRGLRAAFVPWYGPVFWPYAYSDIFSYTFYPAGYEDSYWDYAYDDFLDGVFYGEVGPPQEYVTETTGSVRPAAPAQPTYAAVRDVCATPGGGITAWPIAEIDSKVGLNAEQKQLLADVKSAGGKAADVFKATCPSENAFPLTPPGRLASMTGRLDATLQAVQTVKPALEKFYDSLNDEQKERFNQIGPSKAAVSSEAKEAQASADDAKKCGEAKPGLTNLPIEQIEDVLSPTETQQAELDKLAEATVKAVGVLQAACPAETPLTPPGRLAATETRLQAMIEAANTVKPALGSFYGSLTTEQKARFNRLGRELAQTSATSNQ